MENMLLKIETICEILIISTIVGAGTRILIRLIRNWFFNMVSSTVKHRLGSIFWERDVSNELKNWLEMNYELKEKKDED